MAGWAMVDGALTPLAGARIPVEDPAVTTGWSVFETLTATEGRLDRPQAHLDRLALSCDGALLPRADAALLLRELEILVGLVPDARLRITLTGGGRRILTATPRDPERLHKPVRAVRGPHRDEPFLGGSVKHGSRAPWVVAVKASGVDEVLLVDGDRFTEATTAAILAVIDGVLWTAPHDGRILESTSCLVVLERAARAGIPVRREGPPAGGGWDALYVASATRDLAPVVELDGERLPGWDPVGRRLAGR